MSSHDIAPTNEEGFTIGNAPIVSCGICGQDLEAGASICPNCNLKTAFEQIGELQREVDALIRVLNTRLGAQFWRAVEREYEAERKRELGAFGD